ncbi:D-alanyl-D-alanine carboxypeptidase [Ferruginibacter sp. HRS2-29]|uniref:D-alanyl-D-alanine carboxypeptidase n=1 Tax=Ferruginibacter sp. HRS2-29 TaxID=2487334 RepID=UPI0020CB783B|nr:D-alanyl-D-alanine carboxypeptidase [Ferruginibacter sp. HRS2-29]MCP9752743.1 hypothetical protein [Ferruginibacter sp. HRS2-29]
MKRTAFPLSYFLLIISYSLFASCKTTARVSRQAEKTLIADTAISKGFIGISVFDPSSNTYLYNYNADKYFVPASNVKLFTLYAGMKYLGDSLVGIYYNDRGNGMFNLFLTGDPTFLHPDFKNQPLLDFLKIKSRKFYLSEYSNFTKTLNPLGYGWAWDDYNEDFMVERSQFPIYGNVFRAQYDSLQPIANTDSSKVKWIIRPKFFTSFIDSINYYPIVDLATDKYPKERKFSRFKLEREISNNLTRIVRSDNIFSSQEIPFVTDNTNTAISILWHDFKIHAVRGQLIDLGVIYDKPKPFTSSPYLKSIHSQPSDSLFKPMMHRSDNFFAEQTLLMVSNEHLGCMSDEDIIDTLLKTDLKDAPHKPKWVDGSGLSRYNLFTPQDFIYILNKMKNEFGMERLKTILATGGEGTLKNYFKKDTGFIYAKTGTLSNNCALSGYIITKKNRLLIFSILANNYQTGATPVRKAVEKFVEYIRETY